MAAQAQPFRSASRRCARGREEVVMDVVMGVVMGVVKGVVKRSRAGGLALALLVACSGKDSGRHEQHSVLLVTLDTTRADACRATASAQRHDARARRAGARGRPLRARLHLRADHARGPRLDPHRTGAAAPRPARQRHRSPRSRGHTLAEAAHAAGVQTAAFVGAVVLDRALGLDQGFDVLRRPASAAQPERSTRRSGRDERDRLRARLARRARPRAAVLPLGPTSTTRTTRTRRSARCPRRAHRARALPRRGERDGRRARTVVRRIWAPRTCSASTLVCVTADHGESLRRAPGGDARGLLLEHDLARPAR